MDLRKSMAELRTGLESIGNIFRSKEGSSGGAKGKATAVEKEMTGEETAKSLLAPMDRHQGDIPRLPLPALEETLGLFLTTVKPILTAEEFAETEAVTTKLQESGHGAKAHANLVEYDKTQTEGSYIEKFWDDAYLFQASSLAINTNPTVVLQNGQESGSTDLCERAASICMASLKFAEKCRSRTLEPDMARKTPLDMWQYDMLFGSVRIPGGGEAEGEDKVVTYGKSTHVVVLHRSQFFKFDVCDEQGVLLIDHAGLVTNFNNIVRFSREVEDEDVARTAIAALTGDTRKTWMDMRKRLVSLDEANAKGMEAIDSALFVVVLDDVELESSKENFANMLHGTLPNKEHSGTYCQRWYDKMNIIVTENGYTAVTWEHSMIDGHTILRYVSDVVSDNAVKFVQSVSGMDRVGSFMKTLKREGTERRKILSEGKDVSIKKISFTLDGELETGIKNAQTALRKHIESLSSQVLEFPGYGKDLVKSSKISPDAFVQMSFLYAFYSVQGFLPNQYEAIMTKHFRHGRTAAGRAATFEAKALIEALMDDNSKPKDLYKLLKDATVTHSKMTKRCASGHGVDRPLYGIQAHWQKFTKGVDADFDETLTQFFDSPGWKKLNVTLSSTSFCGNPSLKLFGFGPVAAEGVGVGYILGNKRITTFVDVDAYKAALETYYGKALKVLEYERRRLLEEAKV